MPSRSGFDACSLPPPPPCPPSRSGAPGAPVIKFRNYQPRDAALVGGGGAKPQGQAAGAAAASAPAQPARAPVAVALAPPPAPSVLLAQQEAAESAQLMAKAKDVRGGSGASVGEPGPPAPYVCTPFPQPSSVAPTFCPPSHPRHPPRAG